VRKIWFHLQGFRARGEARPELFLFSAGLGCSRNPGPGPADSSLSSSILATKELPYVRILAEQGSRAEIFRTIGRTRRRPPRRGPRICPLPLQLECLESRLSPATWTALGPTPIPFGQTQGSTVAVSGRVTAIDVDPFNTNIAIVGTAQGGVYRTMNGGNSWTHLLDTASTLAIGAVAFAPSNPNTVYVGTGEGNLSMDSYAGVGVYRITKRPLLPQRLGTAQQGRHRNRRLHRRPRSPRSWSAPLTPTRSSSPPLPVSAGSAAAPQPVLQPRGFSGQSTPRPSARSSPS